jgi:hypothetical protein
MRRSRRGAPSGHEFGGSGEDSFVAVVVTKLTGALLFILLLTMVIMALIPKAVDHAPRPGEPEAEPAPLAIRTPENLPEAIAGRPYTVALAATGGRGALRWQIVGELPDGLTFDASTGQLAGMPKGGTPEPIDLTLQVRDDSSSAVKSTKLVVYQSDRVLTTPSHWKPNLPPIPWRAWMEHGFGFLVLLLVHMVGMNTVAALQRWSETRSTDQDGNVVRTRFVIYRSALRLSSAAAAAALAAWLWWPSH